MAVRFDADAPILGVTLKQYRDVLLSWDRHRTLARLPDARRKGLNAWLNAIVVDDAEARGLFGIVNDSGFLRYAATQDGEGLLKAECSPKIPAAKGRAILDEVLANAAAMNASRDMPIKIARIWLFGSLAKGAEMVGDVDIVVEKVELDSDEDKYHRKLISLACAMGGRYAVERAEFKGWAARDYVFARSVFGSRRNPRLRNHGLWDMQSLECPCKLVFDRSRGGRVEDPLLDRHPEPVPAGSRKPPELALPDLATPGPVLPVALGNAAEAALSYLPEDLQAGPVTALTGAVYEAERMNGLPLLEWSRASAPLDGRHRAILLDGLDIEARRRAGDPAPCLAIEVLRDVSPAGIAMRLAAGIAFDGAEPDGAAVRRLGFVLGSALGLDALRMRRQGLIGEAIPPVAIEVDDEPAWLAAVARHVYERVDELRGRAQHEPEADDACDRMSPRL